jgi:hypothetical protein
MHGAAPDGTERHRDLLDEVTPTADFPQRPLSSLLPIPSPIPSRGLLPSATPASRDYFAGCAVGGRMLLRRRYMACSV